jgi:hypothetical protein
VSELKVWPNTMGIIPNRYFGMMAPLNKKGGLLFLSQSCKESLCYYFIGHAIAPGNTDYMWTPKSEGEANLDKFQMLFTLSELNSTYASVKERAGWVQDVATALGERMGEQIDIYLLEGTSAIIIEAGPLFQRSSVAMHGIMTFLRAASKGESFRAPIKFNTIDEFVDGVLDSNNSQDAEQLRAGVRKENVKGFLDKTLPAMNMDGYEAWLQFSPNQAIFYPGLVRYNKSIKSVGVADEAWFKRQGSARIAQRAHNGYQW